jgi:signal peptidase II
VLYFSVAALVVILDQASKRIIWEIYKHSGGTDVLDGVLRISLSRNKGAIMGLLSGAQPLLLTVTIIAIVALIYFAYRMRYAPVRKRIYLGLILGGAFGNLIDRIATGEVLDFIDMGIGSLRWPTYNVADMAVTIGAFLLILGFVRHAEPEESATQTSEEESTAGSRENSVER